MKITIEMKDGSKITTLNRGHGNGLKILCKKPGHKDMIYEDIMDMAKWKDLPPEILEFVEIVRQARKKRKLQKKREWRRRWKEVAKTCDVTK